MFYMFRTKLYKVKKSKKLITLILLYLSIETIIFYQNKTDSMVDTADKQLLDILKDNSRLSFANLGRKINLSPSAVRERVQKLEDSGVIQKYDIQIDNKKLGYELEAFILLKVFPGQLKLVLKKIKDFPEIKKAHRITGNQNLHLKIVVKNQLGLQKLLDQLMIYGDTNTFLILSEI